MAAVSLAALALCLAVPASAAVGQLNNWTMASSSNPAAGDFSVNAGNVAVSAGSARLLVVAAVFESGGSGTLTNFDASLGGTALTALAASNTTTREVAKVWYLLEAQVPAGPAALVVSGLYDDDVTGLHIYWASFSGVDQTSPFVDSSANYNGDNLVTFGTAVDFVANGLTFYAAGNGSDTVTHTPPAPVGLPAFTQRAITQTNGQTTVIADTPVHGATGTYLATTTVTFSGSTNRSAVVVGSLRPAPADFQITKTDSVDPILVGQTTTYTITVGNNGPANASNVVVTDNLPAGMSYGTPSPSQGSCAGTAPMVCTLGAMNNGSSATITIVATATAVGTVSNTATVAANAPDPNAANNTATQTTTVSPTVNLAVTKSASSTSVWLGDTLSFTIELNNSGPSSATNVTVVDALPAGLTLVTATPSQGTCSGTTTITCSLGGVTAGAGATITITVTANAVGTQVNTATVAASEGDPNAANNTANAFTVVTNQTRNADVAVSKTGVPGSVTIGGNVTYTVTVTNNGPESADDVRLDDPIPAGMTLVSATPTQGTCTGTAIVICSLGRLASGATATVTMVVTNNSSGTKANVATVTNLNSTEYDPNPVNNVATAVTTVTGGSAALCVVPGKDGPGGTLSGVVNRYYPGTAGVAAGVANTCIPVGTPRGAATPISANDLLLVIQMQDATINTSNSADYGDGPGGADGAGALVVNGGKYEFVRARGALGTQGCAASSLPVTGSGTNNGLLNGYTNANALTTKGQERYQVVRVPQYTTATLSGVTAAPWLTNTAAPIGLGTGGILAIDVQGTLTLNAGVAATADGQGFRGAAGRQLAGSAGAGADYLSPSTITTHGGKGESIAGTPRWIFDSAGSHTTCGGANTYYVDTQQPNDGYPGGTAYPAGGSMARGAPANAGGGSTDGQAGANDQNSGGGGGSNGGAGGHGGYSWNTVLDYGGRGAAVTPALTKLVLGGGGGAGTRNNDNCGVNGATEAQEGQASSGAAGGGLIVLRAGELNVNAGAFVSANGADAYDDTLNDGGGGGGAGGSGIVTVNSGTMAGLTVRARGGRGGSSWKNQVPGTPGELTPGSANNRHGPGGGGGGGVIAYTNTAVAPTLDVSGGLSGTSTTANSPFGAQPGGIGQTLFAAPGLIPGAGSGSDCSPDLAIDLAHNEATVSPGGPVTFFATIRNAGPFVSSSGLVTVTVTLDPGLQPGVASGSGWTCGAFSGRTVTCTRSDALAPQLSFPPITITATVLVAGPTTLPGNTATVANAGDFNASNNVDTDPVGVRAPTLAHIRHFTAVRTGTTVRLFWRTGFEVDNLGFRVYRESGGVRTAITPSLVAGSALFTGRQRPLSSGRSYSWLDGPGVPPNAVYWLEDIALNGARGWTGPAKPVALSDPDVSAADAGASLSPLLGASTAPGRRGRGGPSPGIGCGRPCSDRDVSASRRATVSADVTPHWLAAQPAAKIRVAREGWYRVTADELRTAGFEPGNGRSLRLFTDGVQQALALVKNNALGPVQAVEFYGLGIDSPFDGSRVYWLVRDAPGARIGVETPPAGLPPAPPSFAFTLERKDRTVTFFALDNGDAENIFGDPVTSLPLVLDLGVSHLDSAAPWSASLTLALQGVTTDVQHEVEVLVNGSAAGTVTFSGQEDHVATLSVPHEWLHEGANTITLTANGAGEDISLVDYVRLSYAHQYVLDEGALRFTAPAGTQVTLSGLTPGPLRVVDVTDPARPVELVPVVQGEGSDRTATVGIPGQGVRTLFAFGPERAAAAEAVVQNRPSQWWAPSTAADLVVISHASLEGAVAPLLARRQAQGLGSVLVDVTDVYDEQSFGQRTPYAIRSFLAEARLRWRWAPRYVLLVGDASFDPKDYFGFGDQDLVPTKLVPTRYLETDSDDWLVDLDRDGFADLAVGRLPARTPAEAALFVTKILAREADVGESPSEPGSYWAKNVLLVADENDEFDFESATHELRNLVPETFGVREVLVGTAGSAATAQIVEAWNQGKLVVNYTGHGSVEIWGRSGVFGTGEALALQNGTKLPFVVSMTCLNGMFDDIFSESLAETLLKAPNGGAAAVWASSGLTEPAAQATMGQDLFRTLLGGRTAPTSAASAKRIGDAVWRAKAGVSDADVRRTWILFGDPTMPLR